MVLALACPSPLWQPLPGSLFNVGVVASFEPELVVLTRGVESPVGSRPRACADGARAKGILNGGKMSLCYCCLLLLLLLLLL